jgi:hypothetical protein
MRRLILNYAFNLGFLTGILLFIAINLYADRPLANKATRLCFHCLNEWGFPFRYFEAGGNPGIERYFWLGLVGDIFVALIFSFLVGLVFKFVWSKLASRRINLK